MEYYIIYNWTKMSKSNVLLQKSELGKNKAGFHNLPPEDHVYGKAPTKDQYGAREGNFTSTQLYQDGNNTQFHQSSSPLKILSPWIEKELRTAV